jgi:hypothetical protein
MNEIKGGINEFKAFQNYEIPFNRLFLSYFKFQ